MTIIDPNTFLAGEFGSIAALTTGLRLRQKINGATSDVLNLKDNLDILNCFSLQQGTPSPGPSGIFGSAFWLHGSFRFPNPILLDGLKGDRLWWEVRDDLLLVESLQSAINHYELHDF